MTTEPKLSSVLTIDHDGNVAPRKSWEDVRAERNRRWVESLERRPCRMCGQLTVFRDVCGECDDERPVA